MTRELEKRGLGEARRQCQAWMDREWFRFYAHQEQAGWPAQLLSIDMSVPPTPSQCLAISLALHNGGWYQPTPVPLNEQEALWLKGYISDCFSPRVQIQLVLAPGLQQSGQERKFALELSYQLDRVGIASFSDWKRIQGWAAVPARFEREAQILSEDHQADEWKRVQQLRAIIFAHAHASQSTVL